MQKREKILAREALPGRLDRVPRLVELARRRGASRISSWLTPEKSFLPQEVLFFLTYRCNLRCRMCGQWGEKGYVKQESPGILKDELSFEALEPVFDDLATFKPRVFLCGGEVFLYPQWRQVLRSLKEKGLRTTIITNGTRLAEVGPDLVEAGVEQVSISLDGIPEVHDRIRGTPDTFRKALAGIRELLAARDARGERFPRLVVNSTVTDVNYLTLVPFVEGLEASGVDSITLLHFNFISPSLYEKNQTVFRRLLDKGCPRWKGFVHDAGGMDLDAFVLIVREIRDRKFAIPVGFMPDYNDREIREYYTGDLFRPETRRGICKGPWNTVNILPNGDVSPCLDVVVGNVRDAGGFLRVWNGVAMRKFRRTLKEEALFPVCTRCCTYYRF